MNNHSSSQLHDYFVGLVDTVCKANPHVSYDIRASLVTKHRNPFIALLLREGETLDPKSGISTLIIESNDQKPILTWRVRNCDVIERASLNPNTKYLNGLQMVSSDTPPIIGCHAHLHICELVEWPQAVQSFEYNSTLVLPPSYQDFGGHDWYRTIELSPHDTLSETHVIARPPIMPKLKTDGTTYLMDFELVHVDDEKMNPAKHLQASVGRLTSIVQFKLRGT